MKYFKVQTIIAFLILSAITILFPLHIEEAIFELSLYVTPVLFAIFIAFSISERLSRIDKIRENDSIERSSLEMLNSFIESNSLENHKEVNGLIDEYLMATLDYSIEDYYKTKPYYEKISRALYSIRNDRVNDFSVDILSKIHEAREQTVTLTSDYMSKFEWLIYYVLGAGVLVPFLVMNNGSFLNVAFVMLIILSVILLLSFLHELNNLGWKKEVRIFAPYQKTFEAIGNMRYFPESLMGNKKVKKIAGDKYRVGHFPNPYPNFEGKDIKVHNK